VRTDDSISRKSFRFSPEWKRSQEDAELTPEIDSRLAGGEMRDGRYVVHSLSGNERNKLFMNSAGKAFSDLSGISGLDNIADGRGFALFDYNRDGKQDIALVNANAPLFNLYRNAMPDDGNVIALRFVGSNQNSVAAQEQTNRDGYGAWVTVETADGPTLKREHRCGEGFAAQNSATMLIGIGGAENVARLTVRWPSGQVYTLENVAAGALITAHENAGRPFEIGEYIKDLPVSTPAPRDEAIFPIAAATPSEKLRLYTTTATWCEACIRHLPEVNVLAETLAADGVEVIAVPIDLDDDRAMLEKYVKKWSPNYRMLVDLPGPDRTAVTAFLTRQTGIESPPLPSCILTDAQGKTLLLTEGIPTASQVRKSIAAQ
jgi:thiol-disulfide isomerase/thioredoxin